MKTLSTRAGRRLRSLRVTSQIVFGALFLTLLLIPGPRVAPSFNVKSLFLYFDPLILLAHTLTTGAVLKILLLALIPLALTVLLGRFFCGWICPLGALNHLVSALSRRPPSEGRGGDRGLRRLKYLVAALVLVMAALGVQTAIVLDPIALLTRSASVVVVPAVGNASRAVTERETPPVLWGDDSTAVTAAAVVKPIATPVATSAATAKSPATPTLLPPPRRAVRLQAEVVGALLLALLAANFYRRRFYCNYLCPLGGLFGAVARWSVLKIAPGAQCNGCDTCASHCHGGGGPHGGPTPQECVLCFNCASHCPEGSVTVGFVPGTHGVAPTDVGRRQVLGAVLAGGFLSALPGLATGGPRRARDFMRPPGAVAEKLFLERCLRCGACIQACPTDYIQSAGLEAGMEAFWTPVVSARTGYCDFGCTACTRVCAAQALTPLTLGEKRAFKIGTAVIDPGRCLTHADGVDCTVCAWACPVPEKPIRFREVDAGNFEGRRGSVKQAYVVADLCNGCGICEHVCPRRDAPGIVITSDDEDRAGGF